MRVCIICTNEDPKKEMKVKSRLILFLDPIIYVHVQSAKTCKEAWNNLEQALNDSGLCRRVALLRDLITTTLEESSVVVTICLRRRTKVYNSRANPMDEFSEKDFKNHYRFSKENMKKIVNILRDDLSAGNRGGSIPVELQVMAVIRYWGRHEIQEDCAEINGMSQQTPSRICKRVAIALASKSSIYIKMPSSIIEETETIRKFQSICGFPHVIGAIDCTHIKIRKVGGDAGQYYVNRKGQYSINVQIVCNADLKICDIVSHWRGSTHDARIWRESSIKIRFEENEFKGKLIGDSGYPCTPYLFTPVLRPRTESEL
ncbi:hypothetical protein evm_010614 [Chilo suppressalis]|nr:hypothetical protein evm_010614 [Chilo suppressalis]